MSALVEYVGAFTETVLEHLPDARVEWSDPGAGWRNVRVSFNDTTSWCFAKSVQRIRKLTVPAGTAAIDATKLVERIQADEGKAF